MDKKYIFLLVASAMLSGFAGGVLANRFAIADSSKIITAQAFNLVDDNGKLRGVWETKKGNTLFSLYPEKGKSIFGVVIKDAGPMLVLTGKDEKCGFGLSVKRNRPVIAFSDTDGVQRLMVGIEDNAPKIALYNNKPRKLALSLGINKYGPYVFMLDKAERLRAGLVSTALTFIDPKGKVVWTAPTKK